MVVCLKQEAAILSLFDISEVTQKNLTIQGHIAKNCFNFFLHITPPPSPNQITHCSWVLKSIFE